MNKEELFQLIDTLKNALGDKIPSDINSLISKIQNGEIEVSDAIQKVRQAISAFTGNAAEGGDNQTDLAALAGKLLGGQGDNSGTLDKIGQTVDSIKNALGSDLGGLFGKQ
jgi:hypothetical protein